MNTGAIYTDPAWSKATFTARWEGKGLERDQWFKRLTRAFNTEMATRGLQVGWHAASGDLMLADPDEPIEPLEAVRDRLLADLEKRTAKLRPRG